MAVVSTFCFRQRHLPHWEVEGGRYFITVRGGDSPPIEALHRLHELNRELTQTPVASVQAATLQRQVFRSLEKYLNAGFGACPLRQPSVATIIQKELQALVEWEILVPHYSIRPNPWHALLVPTDAAAHSLSSIMKRLKGRTAKRIRQTIGGSGAFWQSEWFDRWVRDDNEWSRLTAYIQNNPAKAGLVDCWENHPWTQ